MRLFGPLFLLCCASLAAETYASTPGAPRSQRPFYDGGVFQRYSRYTSQLATSRLALCVLQLCDVAVVLDAVRGVQVCASLRAET